MPQNITHSGLKHISGTFLSNIGKHVFSPHQHVTEKIQKAKNTWEKNHFNSIFETIDEVEQEKNKNSVYSDYINSISFPNQQFPYCDCKKADCENCCEKFFSNTLLHTKNSGYNRRDYLVFLLLKKHIETLRNKVLKTSPKGYIGIPISTKLKKTSGSDSFACSDDLLTEKTTKNLAVPTKSEKTSSSDSSDISTEEISKKNKKRDRKQVYLLDYLKEIKLQAQKKFELNYPSLLTNIAFIEILLSPIGLTKNKELIDPNLRDIGNLFIGPDEIKHTEKNIKNVFKMFDSEIRKLLVILDSSYTNQRSRTLKTNEWFNWALKEIKERDVKTGKKLKEIFDQNPPVLQHLSTKLRSSNPNKALLSKYNSSQTGRKTTAYSDTIFKTTSDLQQIFGDIVLSGVFLFKCINLNDTTTSTSEIDLRPTNIEKDFIESYCYNDNAIKQLSSIIPPLKLEYDNFIHLFSFFGFSIYHSYLSLNGALNKFKSHFNRKNQLDFLQLENLCNEHHGFNFIKFALYKCEPFMEMKMGNENVKIIRITYEDQNLIRFVFDFAPEMVDENDLELTISKKTIKEMENTSAQLKLTDKNFGLILLRLKELFLFLNIQDFFYFRLQQKYFNKYLTEIEKEKPISNDEKTQLFIKFDETSEIDEYQLRRLTKHVLSIIFHETCRFMIFESALISQAESMRIYYAKKCQDEIIYKNQQQQKNLDFPKYVHAITFENKDDLSNHEFFRESEFYFPKNKHDRYCNTLQTRITRNIQGLENDAKKIV